MPSDEKTYYVLHVEDKPDDDESGIHCGNCGKHLVDECVSESESRQCSACQNETIPAYRGKYRDLVDDLLARYSTNLKSDWTLVRSSEAAVRRLDQVENARPGRGFDLVLCDMHIPKVGLGGAKDGPPYFGVDVISAVRAKGWICPVVVLTNFHSDPPLLDIMETIDGTERPDEWMAKVGATGKDAGWDHGCQRSKLASLVVPVEYLAWTFGIPTDGKAVAIRSRASKRVLAYLASIAQKTVSDRHSTHKVLLTGEPGCGKGMWVQVFAELLELFGEAGKDRHVERINCASLVGDAHGGLIRLFGADGFNQMSQPGAFERATCYKESDRSFGKTKLAPSNAVPDFTQAGVVFLDEFVELPPKLQASILTTLNDGIVTREGKSSTVNIGCHVLMATNASNEQISGENEDFSDDDSNRATSKTLRRDLVDRIQHVVPVPSLHERPEEVELIIQSCAANAINRHDPNANCFSGDIDITPSAQRLIRKALNLGIITSTRQLEVIANVEPDERVISDSNMKHVIKRAEALHLTRHLRESEKDITMFEKLNMLGMHPLVTEQWEELCDESIRAVEALYSLFRDHFEKVSLSTIKEGLGDEVYEKVLLLLAFMGKEKIELLLTDSADAIRGRRSRHLQNKKFLTVGSATDEERLGTYMKLLKGEL